MNMRMIASIAAMLALAGCEQRRPAPESNFPAKTAVATNAPMLEIGKSAKRGLIEFTLKSVETMKVVGNPGWSPEAAPGETFVVVRYQVTNLGDKPLDTFELPEVRLVDGSGVEYGSETEGASFDGDSNGWDDINPGVVFRATRTFKVVEKRYDPAAWKVIVKSDPLIEYRLK